MPIPFRKRSEPEPTPAPPTGPQVLRDGVLLAHWYILRRLDDETTRARRYHRPLSVMAATPVLIPGEQPTRVMLEVGAAAAQAAARATDLVGWLGEHGILVVMPETKQQDANVAMHRWRNEMWMRSQHVGGQKWRFAAIENPEEFETAWQLVAALAERLEQKDAA
jgi:hypothetical protein